MMFILGDLPIFRGKIEKNLEEEKPLQLRDINKK